MKKLEEDYLGQSEEQLKAIVDKSTRAGLEVLSECLVEFFAMLSLYPKNPPKKIKQRILQAISKIESLLNYAVNITYVSNQRRVYQDLLREFHINGTVLKKRSTTNSHYGSNWPPLESEWPDPAHYIHVSDCGLDVRNWLTENASNNELS